MISKYLPACLLVLLLLLGISSGLDEASVMQLLQTTFGADKLAWTGTNYCAWSGISCSSGGSVTAIHFGSLNITGTLPNEIADLRNLTSLDVSDNLLYGTVPAALFTLPSINSLYLGSNSFTGELPTNYSSSLFTIYAYSNRFSGQIPEALADLPNLQNLLLFENNFTCPIPAGFISKIASLTSPLSYCQAYMNPFFVTNGKLCGDFVSTKTCRFLPLVIEQIPFPQNATAQLNFRNGHVSIDGHRVVFASYNSSTGKLYQDEFMAADFFGFSETSSDEYYSTVYNEIYSPPFIPVPFSDGRLGFYSTTTLSNNVTFNFTVELNSTYAPDGAKLAFDMTKWPFVATDSILHLQIQLSLRQPHSNLDGRIHPLAGMGQQIYQCNYDVGGIFHMPCGSEKLNLLMEYNFTDYSFTASSNKTLQSAVFPMYLVADGNDESFFVSSPAARLAPAGDEFEVLRRIASGIDYPFPAASDDIQLLTLNFGFILGRYNDTLSYDPTFQVTRLFDFDDPAPATTPSNEIVQAPSDSTGSIVAGVVVGASVLTVAIIFAIFVIRRRAQTMERLSKLQRGAMNMNGPKSGPLSPAKFKSGKKLYDHGIFGERWSATYDNEPVVTKKLETMENLPTDYSTYTQVESHDNLVKVIGVVPEGRSSFHLIQRIVDGGVPTSKLAAESKLQTDFCILVIRKVVEAMRVIHRSGKVHRNLAARNVIVVPDDMIVKVTDMGFYADIDPVKTNYRQARWLAPESIRSKQFSPESDVWMFGIFVWELFHEGRLPYHDKYPATANLMGLASEIATKCATPTIIAPAMNSWIGDMVRSCWAPETSQRPTFASLAATLDDKILNPRSNGKRSSSWTSARSTKELTNV